MSYFDKLSAVAQRVVALSNVAPLLRLAAYWAVPPTPLKRFTRPGSLGSVNSLSSIPSLRSRHSSGSAPPVLSAIRGKSPSDLFRGKRVSDASAIGLSTQASTLGRTS